MNTNNYLKQIAEMLGVDIGKPFTIEGYENSKFKITKEFFLQSTAEGTWFNSSAITHVLEGRKKIIKLPEFVLFSNLIGNNFSCPRNGRMVDLQ